MKRTLSQSRVRTEDGIHYWPLGSSEVRGQPTLPLQRYGHRGGRDRGPTWLWSQNSEPGTGPGQTDGEEPQKTALPGELRDGSASPTCYVIGPDLDLGDGAKGRQQSSGEETLMHGDSGTWTCGRGGVGRWASCQLGS